MVFANHHEWVAFAANQLMCGSDVLWQAMCCEWAEIAQTEEVRDIINTVEDALA